MKPLPSDKVNKAMQHYPRPLFDDTRRPIITPAGLCIAVTCIVVGLYIGLTVTKATDNLVHMQLEQLEEQKGW